jgi:hypothetical protein
MSNSALTPMRTPPINESAELHVTQWSLITLKSGLAILQRKGALNPDISKIAYVVPEIFEIRQALALHVKILTICGLVS